MAVFVNDTFSGEASTVALESHTGETGATWTVHPSYSSNLNVSSSTGTVFCSNTSAPTGYYTSGVPSGAEYDVQADFVVTDTGAIDNAAGITGRMDTTANTFYMLRYSDPHGAWQLFKAVAGSFTLLGSYSQALSVSSYTARLEIKDATKKVFIDGVERISSTDNAITDAGRAGTRWFISTNGQTGLRLDNFSATDANAGGTGGLLANGLQSGATVSSPALAQTHQLTPNGLTSSSSVSSPALGQTHILSASGLSASAALSSPALQIIEPDSLIAADLTAQTTVSTPFLEQIHTLAANGLAASATISTPAAGSTTTRQLVAQGIVSQAVVGSPALGQIITRHKTESLLLDFVSMSYGVYGVSDNIGIRMLSIDPEYRIIQIQEENRIIEVTA